MPAPPAYALPRLGAIRVTKFAWTQEQLADRSGVGRATVARLENGKPARIGTIHKLAAALEVSPAELMGRA